MNRSRIASIATVAAACAVLSCAALDVAVAQTGGDASAAKPGPVPRLADGHPDLSGVWWGGSDVGGRGGPPVPRTGPPAPSYTSLYQPWAAKKAATLSDKDDPTLNCVPVAFGTLNVRLWSVGAVGQIVATPKFVVLLSETFHDFQLVPTDGRAHRDDQPPTYRGDAVGHWEGDTLVVDTTNFTDDTWMSAEGRVSIHSDALHIIERYRRVDAKTLQIDATVEDPKVLTGPWHVPTRTLQLAPFDEILSLNCSVSEAPAQIKSASEKTD